MKTNIHIYPTHNFQFESRILKETKTIARMGIFERIILVGYQGSGASRDEPLDGIRRIWQVPLPPFSFAGRRVRRILHYLAWARSILVRFRKERPAMVNCHSIHDLPIGVILKKITGCLLIYDAHELETERNGMKGALKIILKIIERYAVKRVEHVFPTSPSYADWYEKKYHLDNITQIFNVPNRFEIQPDPSRIFRDRFQIPSDDIVFLYQGAFMKGRCIPLLLSVFSRIDPKKHAVFMGYGSFETLIKEHAKSHSNIHFHPAVPSDQLRLYTTGADVGLSLIENICLSYYYCLPNKVFEYILSGLPCVVSDFPDMGGLIDSYHCGWRTEISEAAIFDLLNGITLDEIVSKKKGIDSFRERFNWEKEEQKIIPVYRSLLWQP